MTQSLHSGKFPVFHTHPESHKFFRGVLQDVDYNPPIILMATKKATTTYNTFFPQKKSIPHKNVGFENTVKTASGLTILNKDSATIRTMDSALFQSTTMSFLQQRTQD